MPRLHLLPAKYALLLPGQILILLGSLGICISIIIAVTHSPGQFPWDIGGGKGTQADPYLILDCQQLQNISKDPAASYALDIDIQCAESSAWDSGKGFVPIGYDIHGFSGKLDGRGHAIRGIFIHRPTMNGAGLFDLVLGGARIHDLILDADVTGADNVGGVAGWSYGMIDHVNVHGLVSGRKNVGGITGVNQGSVQNVSVEAAVTGDQSVGGIAGWNYMDGIVGDAVFQGNLNGRLNIGGIAGVSHGAIIDGCMVIGSLAGQQSAGAVVGWLLGSKHTASVVNGCDYDVQPRSVPVVGQQGMVK